MTDAKKEEGAQRKSWEPLPDCTPEQKRRYERPHAPFGPADIRQMLTAPKDEWEMIAARAILTKMDAENERKGRYAPKPQVSRSDKPDPAPNSPEDLGHVEPPAPGSLRLTVVGAPVQSSTPEQVELEREDPMPTEDCPSGWERCPELRRAHGPVKDWTHAVGLFRWDSEAEDCLVTRTWSPTGHAVGLYDGGNEAKAVLLADEPGAAFMRGELTTKPTEVKTGCEGNPYAYIRNVLLAHDIKGLLAGVLWSCKPAQVERFGAMPVIAFPSGDASALSYVEFGNAVVRCSDATWEMCKSAMPFEVVREGLK